MGVREELAPCTKEQLEEVVLPNGDRGVLGQSRWPPLGRRSSTRRGAIVRNRRPVLCEIVPTANKFQSTTDTAMALRVRSTRRCCTKNCYRTELAPNLFEVDGASFYEIVSAQNNALHDVLDYLCDELGIGAGIKDAVRGLAPCRRTSEHGGGLDSRCVFRRSKLLLCHPQHEPLASAPHGDFPLPLFRQIHQPVERWPGDQRA